MESSVAKRTVKGRKYYYLDTNVKDSNGKWKKISVYAGAKKPTGKEITKKEQELQKKVVTAEKNAFALNPLGTSTKKNLPKVCLLFCGGTIAMQRNEKGFLRPAKGVEDLLKIAPELTNLVNLSYVFIENIDSTNMQPRVWSKLAEEIHKRYEEYDGFIITHGTDTMAYTASALSLALQNLNKPVVLTGSQMPPDDPASDAKNNLINSCRIASMNLRGVIICFGTKIIQGNKAKKWSEVSLDAFVSHLTGDIGEIATTISIFESAQRKRSSEQELILKDKFENGVLQITLVPGMDPGFVEKIIETGQCKGLILESFGAGNVPDKWNSFIPLIKRAVHEMNIPVIVTTQCGGGTSSHMLTYEGGYNAAKAGAISGKDMTTECAAVKLMWVLAQTKNMDEIKRIIHHSYAGEITP